MRSGIREFCMTKGGYVITLNYVLRQRVKSVKILVMKEILADRIIRIRTGFRLSFDELFQAKSEMRPFFSESAGNAADAGIKTADLCIMKLRHRSAIAG